MPSWIGLPELLILLVIVLLIFGPKKLPEMGRSLGRGMREFKDSVTGKGDDDDKQLEQPGSAQAAPVAAPTVSTASTADEEARARTAEPADASSHQA
jgi:sec-independent protein translocase protein TatA